MRLRIVAATAALALGALAWLPAAGAQNLIQAWQAALMNDPLYAGSRASYRAGLEKLPQARAGLLPGLSAAVGGAYNDVRDSRGMGSVYSGRRGTWELALTQPIFDWGLWQTFEQSKLLVASTEIDLRLAFQDLLLRVSRAYFDVLAAQDTLDAIEAEKAAIAEQLASAKRNFETGNATITDTYEAQARYDLVLALELQGQNDLEVSRDLLAQIIGEPPGALAELPASVQIPAPQPARLQDWSQQAETANFAVLRAQLQARIAERGIEIARSGHYPRLNLIASSGSATDRSMTGVDRAIADQIRSSGRPINNAVGVTLSIPLYAGGGTSSRVTESVELQQKARYDYEASRREAIQATRQFFLGVNTGLARIRALEAGEKSSRAAVEANQLGYEVGVRINLDVLNAQQQLYATQRDLARARYDTLMAGLQLKAASGILAETDLEAINRLLQMPAR